MTLTDAQLAELAAITARDANSSEIWFSGPHGSFTAQAAKDRRALLALVDTLLRAPVSFHDRPQTGVMHLPEGDVVIVDGKRVS